MKHLPLTKQCKNCPWKKSTNPYDIPNGYSVEKHKELKKTISNPDDPISSFFNSQNELKIMACHNSKETNLHCVGWLHNQLGIGNNIALRMSMMNYSNAGDIEVFGEQHKCIDDTLPKD